MTRPLNILIVEDNAVDAELALNALRDHGYEVQWQRVETEAAFLAALANSPDLILSDYSMPRFDGLRALTLVRGSGLDTPFILISGTLGEVAAVEAIKLGADDYLLKDRTARLGPAVGRALEGRRLRRERFHMEDSLKDAETRLRLATEASNIGAWDWNLLTDEVYFSPEWKRQLGYEDHELTNEFSEWESRLHPEDHDRILSDVAAFRADPDKGYDVDYRLRHKDGSYRWIHTQAMLMHDTTGRALRMLGCHVDITSRKQAEQRLNRLNRLHAVQSEIGETIVRTRNREALFEAICRILVQTGQLRLAMLTELEPATGRVLPAARCGADREFLREIKVAVDEGLLGCGTIGTVLRTGRSDCCNDLSMDPRMEPWREAALRQGVGSIAAFPLSCNATIIGALVLFAAEPQYFQDDELRLMEAVAGSISFALEALRGEQKLREQAALLDKAQDAIIVRDLQHHITYWNRSAERLYGWTAEEAVGRSIKELIYRDTAAFMAATEVTLSKGEWVGELDQWTKANRPVVVEARWTLVRDDAGTPTAILAINTNITEKKKVEAQFLRAQRMESIGTLASGIAHDLNNVLAPILASIELIRDEVKSEDGHAMLKTLGSCAQRGADLVRQVLGFARGVEGERMEVNVGHLLREIRQIIRETFPKNIETSTQFPRDLWPVLGDPTQLHQVFMNLCVNARDAMPQGGHLHVAADNAELDEMYAGMHPDARPGSFLVVTVKDSGTGIPASVRDRMFEPFFTTKEIGKGTGLGLSTTLAIVRSHGGWINVCSEPGQGSRFKVYLPAKSAAPASEQGTGPTMALPRGRGETILLVDDEEGIREVTRKILERFGYLVLVATNGAEAVAMYAQHSEQVAVVLTDMAMPVMDGRSTIAALHAMNPRLRIIASSGRENDGAASQAADASVRHFLPKPYTAETVLMTLAEVLGQPERSGD